MDWLLIFPTTCTDLVILFLDAGFPPSKTEDQIPNAKDQRTSGHSELQTEKPANQTIGTLAAMFAQWSKAIKRLAITCYTKNKG